LTEKSSKLGLGAIIFKKSLLVYQFIDKINRFFHEVVLSSSIFRSNSLKK
jgi:hypothetical protein